MGDATSPAGSRGRDSVTLFAIFSVFAVLGALAAVVFSDTRRVVASAWIAGMSIGALFLLFGPEYLAIIQGTVTTLVAISFMVYATMYGEYGAVDTRALRQKIVDAIPAVVVGAMFFGTIFLAMNGHPASESQAVAGP